MSQVFWYVQQKLFDTCFPPSLTHENRTAVRSVLVNRESSGNTGQNHCHGLMLWPQHISALETGLTKVWNGVGLPNQEQILKDVLVWRDKDSQEERANSVKTIKKPKKQQQKQKARCIPPNPQKEALWSFILPGCLKAGSLQSHGRRQGFWMNDLLREYPYGKPRRDEGKQDRGRS